MFLTLSYIPETIKSETNKRNMQKRVPLVPPSLQPPFVPQKSSFQSFSNRKQKLNHETRKAKLSLFGSVFEVPPKNFVQNLF